jgi:hypothetical protein
MKSILAICRGGVIIPIGYIEAGKVGEKTGRKGSNNNINTEEL